MQRPAIPAVDLSIDQKIRSVLMPVKANIEISNGVRSGVGVNQDGWKQRSVTLEMLINAGVITEEQARSMYQEP